MNVSVTYPESLHPTLIAPCGMNCGICSAHLKARDPCDGCGSENALRAKSRATCRIMNCTELVASQSGFCYECEEYPCTRLRHLDERYRTRYGMSMLENLESIRERGVEAFVASERTRWTCPGCGGLICVHKPSCIYCGRART